jgi:hypothetical protein
MLVIVAASNANAYVNAKTPITSTTMVMTNPVVSAAVISPNPVLVIVTTPKYRDMMYRSPSAVSLSKIPCPFNHRAIQLES